MGGLGDGRGREHAAFVELYVSGRRPRLGLSTCATEPSINSSGTTGRVRILGPTCRCRAKFGLFLAQRCPDHLERHVLWIYHHKAI